MRLETAGENVKDLNSKAIAFEKERTAVPQSLSKFIADAEEREAVAWAVYNSKAKAASAEASLAAAAGDAIRELAARSTINLLQGRGAATHLDLARKPREYSPPAPVEPPRTMEYAQIQDPYLALRQICITHVRYADLPQGQVRVLNLGILHGAWGFNRCRWTVFAWLAGEVEMGCRTPALQQVDGAPCR